MKHYLLKAHSISHRLLITLITGVSVLTCEIFAYARSAPEHPALQLIPAALQVSRIKKKIELDQEANLSAKRSITGKYLPQLSATVNSGYGRYFVPDKTEGFERLGTVEVTQNVLDLYTAGEISVQGLEVQKNSLQLGSLEQEIIYQVLIAYTDLVNSKLRLDRAIAHQEATQSYFKSVQKRFKLGDLNKSVLTQAQSLLQLRKASVIVAQRGVDSAEIELVHLTGQSPPKELLPIEFTIPFKDLRHHLHRLPNANPTMKILQLDEEIADQRISLERKQHWPVMQAAASASQSKTKLFDGVSYVAELRLAIPLFSGGSTSATVDQNIALRKGAEKLKEETYRQIYLGIEKTLVQFESALESLKTYQEARRLSAQSLRSVINEFKIGATTISSVYLAEDSLARSEIELSRALQEIDNLRLQILRQTGNLSFEKIHEILRTNKLKI